MQSQPLLSSLIAEKATLRVWPLIGSVFDPRIQYNLHDAQIPKFLTVLIEFISSICRFSISYQ
jgi:hypothetical protein